MSDYIDLTKPKEYLIADTPNGKLRGFKQDDVYHFLGVRYGNAKRWQMATMVEPWDGVVDATEYGPIEYPSYDQGNIDCMGVPRPENVKNEDCLNLQLWTGSMDPEAKLPVMIYFHGGGLTFGNAISMEAYNGANQARTGMVMICVNHRLNIFGYLDASEYGKEYWNSGNLGSADLVLALRWIHENITSFGGDPGNVTIFGQSGGGMKVTSVLQIPAAAGLYHRAIIQSGIIGGPKHEDGEYSRVLIKHMLDKLGTDDFNVLVEMEPLALIDLYNDCDAQMKREGYDFGMGLGLVKGDYYLGDPVINGFSDYARTVPLMCGTNIQEMPSQIVPNKHEIGERERKEIMKAAYPIDDVDKLIKLFNEAWPGMNILDAVQAKGTERMRVATVDYVKARIRDNCAPTYNYLFSYESLRDGGRRMWHSAEICYVFRNLDRYTLASETTDGKLIEHYIADSWRAFAYNGDPNNASLPCEWPACREGDEKVFIIDHDCEVRDQAFDEKLNRFFAGMKSPVGPRIMTP